MKNQNKKMQDKNTFAQMLEGTQLAEATELDIAINDDVCVIHKAQMTALEVSEVITALTTIASDLTVVLAAACGFCDNCGDENPVTCADCTGSAACAQLNGCKDTPADWVANCSLCRGLMDESQKIRLPDYVLEDAGIPKGAKLEAFADDEGEIVVTEAEYQKDINDVSPGIISVLVASGICLAELDELIMDEEIVYGA